jgi:general secretion pathway protein A
LIDRPFLALNPEPLNPEPLNPNLMYLDYYNISENPFDMGRDKTSLWLGGSLPKVSLALKEAIIERKGIVVLTGDAGSGKRTAINMITDILQDQFNITTLSNPEISSLDFFNFLSVLLKFNKSFNSKSAFLVHLRKFLLSSASNKKKLLLIINNADRLKNELFDELALLSEIGLSHKKRISILLVGQKEGIEASAHKKIEKISNHITLKYNLAPLNKAETAEYIRHRLGTVGTNDKIFSDKAIHEIFSFSKGNFNLINSICDLSLRKGFSSKKKRINAAIVIECRIELEKKGVVDSEIKYYPKFVVGKEKKKKPTTTETVSPRRWLWIKTLLVLLFIFSSYVLYKSQTKKTNIWKTDEIVQKDYDFHKLNKEEINSRDPAQGASQGYSELDTEKPETAPNSPVIVNEDLEPLSVAKKAFQAGYQHSTVNGPFQLIKKSSTSNTIQIHYRLNLLKSWIKLLISQCTIRPMNLSLKAIPILLELTVII